METARSNLIRAGERDTHQRHLTRTYRQSIVSRSHLDDSSSSDAWRTSQYILDRLWEDEDESFLEERKVATTVVYACQSCGATLFPGADGADTKLVPFPQPRSKSERRRRLRKQQKQHEQKCPSRVERCRGSATAQDGSRTSQNRCWMFLQDESCTLSRKHKPLRIRCGHCQATTLLFQGPKRDIVQPRSAIVKGGVPVPSRRDGPRDGQQTPAPSTGEDAEFLKLPPAQLPQSSTESAKLNRQQSSAKATGPATIQSMSRKAKKKRKKPSTSQSKLYDFLSTLND